MKERPILFSAPMVRALLAGNKTQTRRIVKTVPNGTTDIVSFGDEFVALDADKVANWTLSKRIKCPYGNSGDRLWVKEAYYAWGKWVPNGLTKRGRKAWKFVQVGSSRCHLDGNKPSKTAKRDGECGWVYRHGRFMPKAHSRITLEVTKVRVQRLQDITGCEAISEGVGSTEFWKPSEVEGKAFEKKWWDDHNFWNNYPQIAFRNLWESINGEGSWDSNPFVWAVSFTVLERS